MVATVYNEGRRAGEFMVSEANNTRSREVGTFINSGTAASTLVAGTVLGLVTATNSYATYTNAGTLGLQAASAILWDNLVIPAAGTVAATVIVRDAEVNAAELTYAVGAITGDKTAALVDLRLLGIVGR